MRTLRRPTRTRPAILRNKNGFSAIKPMWSSMLTMTCRWEWWSLRPGETLRGFCCRGLKDWRRGILRFSLASGVVVIADRGYDSKGNNEFVHRNGGVPFLRKGSLPEGKLHDGIYTAEGVPTCLGGRCRRSALIPIPGIICTVDRRAVAPGVKRCGLFPLVMTRRGRTRR